MIWTYEMDLALCKLVYLNSPEILIEGVRDRTKNYHSVLEDFNKQFRLQVKQARTVRARFERLLLDYKSRASTNFAANGRESELDTLMKTLVNMESDFYQNNKLQTVTPSDMVENAIDALKEIPTDQLYKTGIDARNELAGRVIGTSDKLKDVTKSQNIPREFKDNDKFLYARGSSKKHSVSSKVAASDASNSDRSRRISDEQSGLHPALDNDTTPQNIDTELLHPPAKKYKRSDIPQSQPFTITNYLSDNKTFIMNGDGGTQQVSGKSDLKDLTDRVQTDLSLLKEDVEELSALSKQIAQVLKRATASPESNEHQQS